MSSEYLLLLFNEFSSYFRFYLCDNLSKCYSLLNPKAGYLSVYVFNVITHNGRFLVSEYILLYSKTLTYTATIRLGTVTALERERIIGCGYFNKPNDFRHSVTITCDIVLASTCTYFNGKRLDETVVLS